jgi:peptide/nickel transport system ATP-binding protein
MERDLLMLSDLRVEIEAGGWPAVDGVSLSLRRGEIVGLVGESGCGKSLTALCVAGLLPEGTRAAGGRVVFEGEDLLSMATERRRRLRGREMAMIYQEPMSTLNPVRRVGAQVEEPLLVHTGLTASQRREAAIEMLAKVGLPRPRDAYASYPHQLSGGMRQRAVIAMALICGPKLLIADEPTTALDVTIQARILDLLRSVNEELGCAILLISHDLGVVGRLCDRVAVMYAGSIAEEGATSNIFIHPVHRYTRGLLGSIPSRASRGARLANIPGRVPDPSEPRTGCSFAPRCPDAREACFARVPGPVALGPSHSASCVLAADDSEMEY